MAGQFFHPRPEYPRPDFQRGTVEGFDWVNLNGPWQFRFDGGRRGVEDNWFQNEQPEWREQIIVPFCWESLAAWGEGDAAGNDNFFATRVYRNPVEITRANHRSAARYEVGWYRRKVRVPANTAWQNKRVILKIGASDFFTDCWCNGRHVGRHEGGYTPFEFDLTEAIGPGNRAGADCWIVLRVEDPMDNSEQPVGKQWRWYTTTSGIWQTVYLEPREPAHIRSFRIYPDIDRGTARFVVQCAGVDQQCGLEVEISPPQGASQNETLKLEGESADRTIKLNSVLLWDPNFPNLYQVSLRLRQGDKVVDAVHSYFGLRKIDFEISKEKGGTPAALRLNGVARYLRGALYQSYFPDGVYTATSVETLKRDIEWAKKFGFNFLRIHIKVDDPLLLYWADRLGILLMADFPNFGEGGDTANARRRFEEMMREAIERDFNHPSIFAWCLFNETWGFGGQDKFLGTMLGPVPGSPEAGLAAPPTLIPIKPTNAETPQKWVQRMWELAKKLDPTRLVEDMSVVHWDHLEYYQHGDTDINSWHFYISDYTKAREHIDKIVAATFIGSDFNYVPGFQHKGQPLINSEYGGVGALDGDRDVSWSFKFLTNEMRRHQQISAYIYTELHDVEWEYNGFLNYDRTPKDFGYDPRIINESNALPFDSPPVSKVSLGEIVRLPVSSAHYSTTKYDKVTLNWELGGIDCKGVLHQDLATGWMPIPFPHRAVSQPHIVELKMPATTMLCTLLLSARTSDGQTLARNFLHYFVTDGYPPAKETLDRTVILRGTPGDWVKAEWSGGGGDREKERAEDCCWGFGHGFYEWELPLAGVDFSAARRVKILVEASSHRTDFPQTDGDIFPTTMQIFLNDVRLYEAVLRNHPHDSRGVLSYWRGGPGGYGYLVHAFAENPLIQEIASRASNEVLRLRLAVPEAALAKGGLAVYGAQCGRFPICPTVIIEW